MSKDAISADVSQEDGWRQSAARVALSSLNCIIHG